MKIWRYIRIQNIKTDFTRKKIFEKVTFSWYKLIYLGVEVSNQKRVPDSDSADRET